MAKDHQHFLTENKDGILVVTFNHSNKHNPFNEKMMLGLVDILQKANTDETVRAIVLTGGEHFCVGGDFNEVQKMSTAEEVDAWVKRIANSYKAPLTTYKPVIAAANGFTIGFGYQLFLTADYRIAAHDTKFLMPELEKGIACTFGATMLAHILGGIGRMQGIIYGSSAVKPSEDSIVHIYVPKEQVIERAMLEAKRLAQFPSPSFSTTKKLISSWFIKKLDEITPDSILAHQAAILSRSAQPHFQKILHLNHRQASPVLSINSQPMRSYVTNIRPATTTRYAHGFPFQAYHPPMYTRHLPMITSQLHDSNSFVTQMMNRAKNNTIHLLKRAK